MGVYIKGMEMPPSCLECRLYNDPWCMAKKRNQWRTSYNRPPKGERQNDCPLVPVPSHGRLIDADAAVDAFRNATADGDKVDFCEWVIRQVPTIIEAEEGK